MICDTNLVDLNAPKLPANTTLIADVGNVVKNIHENSWHSRCDVTLKCGITICRCLIFIGENRNWVSLPSAEFIARDNQRRYVNIFKFTDIAKAQFEYEILAAFGLAEARLV